MNLVHMHQIIKTYTENLLKYCMFGSSCNILKLVKVFYHIKHFSPGIIHLLR
jgi:hypothetical protein